MNISAASQLRNTDIVNTLLKTLFLNSLLKASLVFVLGEALLQPSRFFIVNTTLRNGPSKIGHDLAFFSYSGKHVEALEIHGMLYLQLASGPVHHVNHHSFASGLLSAHT